MPKARAKRCKSRNFRGNRYAGIDKKSMSDASIQTPPSASTSKLKNPSILNGNIIDPNGDQELHGNRIIDLQTLVSIFSILCCPVCLQNGLELCEDSLFGLCSNFCLKCNNCSFMKGFSSCYKVHNVNTINTNVVLGLRLIGKGYTAAKKLFSTLSLPFLSKLSFRRQEEKLLDAVSSCAQENMDAAASEVRILKKAKSKKVASCGVSVDGTWQRRGYSSLNGCTSAISIDTGKILDVEIMSQYCRICNGKKSAITKDHTCLNHKGSAGNMEVVGAYRMFERSRNIRQLQYSEYYGDGDSKGFESVKDMYGVDSVSKLECIGHVQKRVGGHLRKLKKTKKGLGGKGKLTDKFINKLQNYYGIAIRSNVGNLSEMQSAVIAAFFHCCSSSTKPMHRQCPQGPDSWCKFQKAEFAGIKLQDKSPGLPTAIINTIKPVYMKLCDQVLIRKCLHGKTQNCNESFNGVVWNLVPKETFVELQTLRLGIYIAVIVYNSGYTGLLPVFEKLGMVVGQDILKNFCNVDNTRIIDSKRHSLPSEKISRKKRKAARKNKSLTDEVKEGLTYKSGEF